MGTFTKIPQDTFDGLQIDAGLLLKSFDPASPSVSDANIICATSGGINVQVIPQYEDLGSDVDNCPNNTKQLKKLTGYDCKITTTCISADADAIRLAIGAADKAGVRVVPRNALDQADFQNIWWVGDLANGGFVAVKLLNALSTGGLSLQTTKNGKGTISIELTGHVDINSQNVVPAQFWVAGPTEYTVTNTLTKCTNSNSAVKAAAGHSYLGALTPDTGYHFAANAVTVTMGGTDITSTAYDDGIIVIDEVTGAIVITATATS